MKFLSDFTGGLREGISDEAIADNELSIADNFYFDPATQSLVSLPPLTQVGTLSGVVPKDVAFLEEARWLVKSTLNKLYEWSYANGLVYVGEATGNGRLKVARFDDKWLIATGSYLQQYYNGSLTTIQPHNKVTDVFTRVGRIVVVEGDQLFYSNVGEVSFDDELFLQIGYKDGGYITGTAVLDKWLVVFKSTGNVFVVSSEYPDWVVTQIASKMPIISAIATPNKEVYCITKNDVYSLKSSDEAGTVQGKQAGRKIKLDVVDLQLVHHNFLNQILLSPTYNSNFYYVYHYLLDAWTRIKIPFTINAVSSDNYLLHIFGEDKVYALNPLLKGNKSVTCNMESRLWVSDYDYFIQRADVLTYSEVDFVAEARIGGLVIPLTNTIAKIDGNKDKISGNINYIWVLPKTEVTKKNVYRGRGFKIRVSVSSGILKLRGFKLDISEKGGDKASIKRKK